MTKDQLIYMVFQDGVIIEEEINARGEITNVKKVLNEVINRFQVELIEVEPEIKTITDDTQTFFPVYMKGEKDSTPVSKEDRRKVIEFIKSASERMLAKVGSNPKSHRMFDVLEWDELKENLKTYTIKIPDAYREKANEAYTDFLNVFNIEDLIASLGIGNEELFSTSRFGITVHEKGSIGNDSDLLSISFNLTHSKNPKYIQLFESFVQLMELHFHAKVPGVGWKMEEVCAEEHYNKVMSAAYDKSYEFNMILDEDKLQNLSVERSELPYFVKECIEKNYDKFKSDMFPRLGLTEEEAANDISNIDVKVTEGTQGRLKITIKISNYSVKHWNTIYAKTLEDVAYGIARITTRTFAHADKRESYESLKPLIEKSKSDGLNSYSKNIYYMNPEDVDFFRQLVDGVHGKNGFIRPNIRAVDGSGRVSFGYYSYKDSYKAYSVFENIKILSDIYFYLYTALKVDTRRTAHQLFSKFKDLSGFIDQQNISQLEELSLCRDVIKSHNSIGSKGHDLKNLPSIKSVLEKEKMSEYEFRKLFYLTLKAISSVVPELHSNDKMKRDYLKKEKEMLKSIFSVRVNAGDVKELVRAFGEFNPYSSGVSYLSELCDEKGEQSKEVKEIATPALIHYVKRFIDVHYSIYVSDYLAENKPWYEEELLGIDGDTKEIQPDYVTDEDGERDEHLVLALQNSSNSFVEVLPGDDSNLLVELNYERTDNTDIEEFWSLNNILATILIELELGDLIKVDSKDGSFSATISNASDEDYEIFNALSERC